jgi:hypothetical protein
MPRLYVIGDREAGVLFVKTDPLMLTQITKATIQSYATAHGQTYDQVLGQIAGGAKAAINKTASSTTIPDIDTSYEAIGKLVGAGSAISDVQFCFAAELGSVDWSSNRWTVPPISAALAQLTPPTSPQDFLQLRSAPLG